MPWKSAFANSIPPSCFKVQLFLTALVEGRRLFTNWRYLKMKVTLVYIGWKWTEITKTLVHGNRWLPCPSSPQLEPSTRRWCMRPGLGSGGDVDGSIETAFVECWNPLKNWFPFIFFFKMKDFSLFGQSNSFPHFGWMSFELTGIDTHILPTNLDSTNVIPFWLLPASYKERSARNMSESQSVNLSCFCFTVHKAPVYNIWQKLQMLRCLFSNASVMLSYTAGKDTRF